MINGIAWDFYCSILIGSTLINTWLIYKLFLQHKDKRDMAEQGIAQAIKSKTKKWRG